LNFFYIVIIININFLQATKGQATTGIVAKSVVQSKNTSTIAVTNASTLATPVAVTASSTSAISGTRSERAKRRSGPEEASEINQSAPQPNKKLAVAAAGQQSKLSAINKKQLNQTIVAQTSIATAAATTPTATSTTSKASSTNAKNATKTTTNETKTKSKRK